jgi:hypothetical protein
MFEQSDIRELVGLLIERHRRLLRSITERHPIKVPFGNAPSVRSRCDEDDPVELRVVRESEFFCYPEVIKLLVPRRRDRNCLAAFRHARDVLHIHGKWMHWTASLLLE